MNKLHAPYRDAVTELLQKREEKISALEVWCRPPDDLSKPWDANSFGIMAEKVLCDGCGLEIDPRNSEDLCKKCMDELRSWTKEDY